METALQVGPRPVQVMLKTRCQGAVTMDPAVAARLRLVVLPYKFVNQRTFHFARHTNPAFRE